MRLKYFSILFIFFSIKALHYHYVLQNSFYFQGAVTAIHLLLLSPLPDVQLPALQCLAFLVYGNPTVASVVAASTLEDGHSVVEAVVTFMDRHHKVEMQLAAARVISYLNR